MSLVPVVIPFFKEREKLEKCLAAIGDQTHARCETFVRDNTNDNILFTAAVNEGLSKYCYRPDIDYVLVLNQDAYLHRDCIRQLVAFMDAHPDCGIACPLQVAQDGRTVTWGGSLQAFPFGVHRCDDLARYVQPAETYWANGACMMIRTSVVREVGLFDRNMRFICSDSDFSFSARARGWKVFLVPGALVEHSLGTSGREASAEIERVKARDALYFAQKWLSGDLYRQLSFEGSALTRGGVKQEVDNLRRTVKRLQPATRGEPPGPIVFPSWVAAMGPSAPGGS
ncbi:MAG: glycosyltransferase family 2 protein [Ramlibacter sp.]|nr:glycosyltransferase family 2 protein [Ramlibacter sp.]